MTKDTFLHLAKQGECLKYKGYILFCKPSVKLCNFDKGIEEKYGNVAEAYEKAIIEGEKLKEIVDRSSYDDIFNISIDDGSIKIE